MSLDTIKMFFQVERNKLIGIGVASCLVTTAIVAPITYFTGQPKYDGVVKPISFNTVSATGKHLADYGELDVIEDEYGWGNEEYLTYVTRDADLLKNVMETENGLGFLGKNVIDFESSHLGYDEANILEADFGDGMVLNDDPNYKMVAPINIYMRVPAPVSIFFKANLMDSSLKEPGKKSIWDEGLTSNDVKNNNLAGWDDVHKYALASYFEWAINGNYLDDILMDFTFFNWMLYTDPGMEDSTTYNALDGYGNPNKESNPDNSKLFIDNVENLIGNIETLNSIIDNPVQFNEDSSSTSIISIAGTGTDEPFVEAKISSFNNQILKKLDENKDQQETVSTDLTRSGSSTAWYMPNEAITFDTDKDSNAGEWNLSGSSTNSSLPPEYAFIGTQSRRSYYGSYTSSTTGDKSISGMSQWGYGYQSTDPAPRSSEWNYMEQPHASDIGKTIDEDSFGIQTGYKGKEEELKNDPYANEVPWMFSNANLDENEIMNTDVALPLGFTATTDPLVFFTAGDTEFYYHGDNHKDSKHPGGHPEGTYKPTGMTPEGTNLIFENPTQAPNVTWEYLLSLGFIEAEQVK